MLGKRLWPAQTKTTNGDPTGEAPLIGSADRISIQSQGVGVRVGDLIESRFSLPNASGPTWPATRLKACRTLGPNHNWADKDRLIESGGQSE